MKKTMSAAAVILVLLGGLAVSGCRRVPISQVQGGGGVAVETTSVPLGGATKLDATVRMGVGDLRISGEPSSTTALDAHFRYAPTSWKPEVTYAVAGDTGALSVVQPDQSKVPPLSQTENTWDLKLPAAVPAKLSLNLGVGTSRISLAEVDVRDLEVTTGVGESTIDLSGPRTADMTGHIDAGVGSVTLRLPRNVGVRVIGGTAGVGSLSYDGLTKDGDTFVNAAFAQPGPKIDLTLTRGVGDVKLVLVD